MIQPIIGGTASGSEHDAVVVLATFNGGVRQSLCTATVVAPNLIITARHCVSDAGGSTACSITGSPITGGMVKADRDPQSLVVFTGEGGVAPDAEVEANGSAHGSQLVVDTNTTICNDDIAFVVLDRPLTTPVAPIRLGPPKTDEPVTVVGWGIDESGSLPQTREARTNVALIGIGPGLYPENKDYGYGDREFMLGESACSGDSGSPSLAPSGAVTGVAARAGNGKTRDPNNYASTCMGATAHAVYTHLSSMTELVTRAFDAAGEPIWLEGSPDPRAPKAPPAAEPPAPPSPQTTTAGELPPESVEASAPAPASGGCTIAYEPQKDAVEQAAGFAAMLAFVARLRRRAFRKTED